MGHMVAPWVIEDVMDRVMPKQWNIGTWTVGSSDTQISGSGGIREGFREEVML